MSKVAHRVLKVACGTAFGLVATGEPGGQYRPSCFGFNPVDLRPPVLVEYGS